MSTSLHYPTPEELRHMRREESMNGLEFAMVQQGHGRAALDVHDHLFTEGAYAARIGATPMERQHGVPNFLDI